MNLFFFFVEEFSLSLERSLFQVFTFAFEGATSSMERVYVGFA